jgi:AAHS family 4-hydroxybenzoate transporter-like MFS transporter
MVQSRLVNVSNFIDAHPVGRLQIRLIVACTIIAALEGFDVQAMVFSAPVLANILQMAKINLGWVMAASLVGVVFGASLLGILSDRFGRKKTILISILMFGLSSLLTTRVMSLDELLAVRFLTGIGIGGVYPNIAALASEYTPNRIRAVLLTLMFSGFSLGAIVGGVVNANLIALFGWKAAFVFDGVVPLLLFPLFLFIIPESLYYLARRVGSSRGIDLILQEIEGVPCGIKTTLVVDVASRRSTVVKLFIEKRGAATALIGLCFFANLMLLGFLFNWLPIVLRDTGMSLNKAIYAVVALQLGGILGGLMIGRLVDQYGSHRVLPSCLMAGAVFTGLVGTVGAASSAFLLGLLFGVGAFAIGSQFCLYAFVAQFYPSEMRATGVGWATSVGRIGSIVGPVVGGIILSLNLTLKSVFLLASVPALISAAALLVVEIMKPQPEEESGEIHMNSNIVR